MSMDLTDLARRSGLVLSGQRPSLGRYLRELWSQRSFIAAFAHAQAASRYGQARLGQLWQLGTPLLNALVFYLVFGVVLRARHDVPDYVPFLITGVFVWTFTQSCVMGGVRSISGSLGLIRALYFPRAALPVGRCLEQLEQMLTAMAVLAAVLVVCGQRPDPSWALAVPILLLQTLFNAGLALAAGRAGAASSDLAQVLPFLLRTWMYFSGVMYSLSARFDGALLAYNPVALYIDLLRFALIDSYGAGRLVPGAWWAATGWAVLSATAGLAWFWRAEGRYGRG